MTISTAGWLTWIHTGNSLHENYVLYLILCCMFLVIFTTSFSPKEYHLQINCINNRNIWNHSVLICCPVVLGSFLTLLCGVCFPFLKAWSSLLAVYMWKDQHNLWIETVFKYITRHPQTGYWILCLLLYIAKWSHIFCFFFPPRLDDWNHWQIQFCQALAFPPLNLP